MQQVPSSRRRGRDPCCCSCASGGLQLSGGGGRHVQQTCVVLGWQWCCTQVVCPGEASGGHCGIPASHFQALPHTTALSCTSKSAASQPACGYASTSQAPTKHGQPLAGKGRKPAQANARHDGAELAGQQRRGAPGRGRCDQTCRTSGGGPSAHGASEEWGWGGLVGFRVLGLEWGWGWGWG
jgi:hypothetical protein